MSFQEALERDKTAESNQEENNGDDMNEYARLLQHQNVPGYNHTNLVVAIEEATMIVRETQVRRWNLINYSLVAGRMRSRFPEVYTHPLRHLSRTVQRWLEGAADRRAARQRAMRVPAILLQSVSVEERDHAD